MSTNDFDRYGETFFEPLHEGLDFERVARGFGEFYYDCLPVDRDAPILDLGCGAGQFLRFLEIQGYRRAEGVDVSRQQAEQARNHVHFPVHHGEPEDFLSSKAGFYAAITLNDVLEHVPKNQTIGFLQMLGRSLRPDGVLVANVPAATGLTTAFNRYIDFSHQLVFTEMSLRQVLLMAGFKSVRFVPERWPLKFTLRHLSFRLVRFAWYRLLKLIYFLESPGGRMPTLWQARLVAVASFDVQGEHR